MRRVMLFDRQDRPLGELSPREVYGLTRQEEVNGTHSLTIRTTRVLQQGWRILTRDGMGKWREHVVYGTDASHANGDTVGEYYCVWSVMADLAGTTVSEMPGVVQLAASAGTALDAALSGTSRWVRGTVTQMSTGGASMYDMSGWEAIDVLLDNWGGELDTTIEVSASKVTARKVDLYELQGSSTATRRYDFGADLKSIRRRIADGPLFCRISPRGKGVETEGGGYGRKVRINDDNPSQPDWLEYQPMVDAAKLPNGSGGWEYPTLIVENSDIDDPDELRTWGESVIAGYCTPNVTYDVDVVQASAEGIDMQGVALGDVVHLVDRKFGDGIRLSGRVTAMTVDMLDERNVKVTIGSASQWLADTLAALDARFDAVHSALTAVVAQNSYMATAAYIDSLLGRINAEVNATGGFVYITQGQGIRTYSCAVSDPLVGAEAKAVIQGGGDASVVEIKGGTMRIANSLTSGGDWDWRTVIQSGLLIADLVTAAAITSGTITSADGKSYWNLDTGGMRVYESLELVLGKIISYSDVIAKMATVTGMTNNYPGYSSYTTFQGLQVTGAPSASSTSDIAIGFMGNTSTRNPIPAIITNNSYMQILTSNGYLTFSGGYMTLSSQEYNVRRELRFLAYGYQNTGLKFIDITIGGTSYMGFYGSESGKRKVELGSSIPLILNAKLTVNGSAEVTGSMTVRGTKPRLVETPNYNERLLYAYETPSPYFGDIGSGTIGDDGLCYVGIDDIFSETARADLAYQVFLQKCGQGDLWVEDKAPTHFVVAGTPGLKFDWELKCRQRDYEMLRMEQPDLDPAEMRGDDGSEVEDAYSDEYESIGEQERTANG